MTDLKPENVLVAHDEDLAKLNVKVVDFGISMLASDDHASPASAESLPYELPKDKAAELLSSAFAVTTDASMRLERRPTASTPTRTDGGELSQRGAGLTQTGVIMGTPLYMAPELGRGAKYARPSSDIFSFGVLAYEVLTGQLPSEQPPILQIFRPGRQWFQPLSTRCPELPEDLARLIEQCLSPSPEARPTSAELAAAIRQRHWGGSGSQEKTR